MLVPHQYIKIMKFSLTMKFNSQKILNTLLSSVGQLLDNCLILLASPFQGICSVISVFSYMLRTVIWDHERFYIIVCFLAASYGMVGSDSFLRSLESKDLDKSELSWIILINIVCGFAGLFFSCKENIPILEKMHKFV